MQLGLHSLKIMVEYCVAFDSSNVTVIFLTETRRFIGGTYLLSMMSSQPIFWKTKAFLGAGFRVIRLMGIIAVST